MRQCHIELAGRETDHKDNWNLKQYKWMRTKLTRQLVCILISLLSSIPFAIVLGVGVGMVYVEVENVSSFEGGTGLAVLYMTYAIAPIVVLVNIAIHLALSAEGWPKRLLSIDALSVLILVLASWMFLLS